MATYVDPVTGALKTDAYEDFSKLAADYGVKAPTFEELKGIDPFTQISTEPSPAAQRTEQKLAEVGRYTTEEIGPSARAVRDLDLWRVANLAGAVPSPELSQRAESVGGSTIVARAQPVAAPTGQPSNIGLTNTIGSEFGEVDRPSRGGYTEPNWNVGAWGDSIEGRNTEGVALPVSKLTSYGKVDSGDFAKKFNANYEVQIVNPQTGVVTTAPLKDKGPGESTGAGLDMTWGTREKLGFEPNFKGAVQYRIVPKGTAAPEGTALVSGGGAGGTTTTIATADTSGTGPIQLPPVDRSTLRVPTGRNDLSPAEVSDYARSQTDDYVAGLANAGVPTTLKEYKEQYQNFFSAAQKQNIGLPPERLPADQMDKIASLHTGIDLIDNIYKLQQKVWKKAHPGGAAVPGLDISAPITQTDEFKAFDTARQTAMSTLARGVGGQTGVLTDNDVKIIKDALPNEHDTPEQARQKSDILKSQSLTMMRDKLRYLRAAHYDTEEFDRNYDRAQKAYNSSPTQAASAQNEGLDSQQKTAKWNAYNEKASRLVKPVDVPKSRPPQPLDPEYIFGGT